VALLSSFAFRLSLRHYTVASVKAAGAAYDGYNRQHQQAVQHMVRVAHAAPMSPGPPAAPPPRLPAWKAEGGGAGGNLHDDAGRPMSAFMWGQEFQLEAPEDSMTWREEKGDASGARRQSASASGRGHSGGIVATSSGRSLNGGIIAGRHSMPQRVATAPAGMKRPTVPAGPCPKP